VLTTPPAILGEKGGERKPLEKDTRQSWGEERKSFFWGSTTSNPTLQKGNENRGARKGGGGATTFSSWKGGG